MRQIGKLVLLAILVGISLILGRIILKSEIKSLNSEDMSRPKHRGPNNHTTLLMTTNLKCKKNLDLVILVTTHAFTGSKRRQTIRETWGAYRPEKYNITNKAWQTFFVVGNNTRKEHEAKALRRESDQYGDLIEGDFEETFNNLPIKLQVGFEWAHLYCTATFIHKTDDDVFLNPKNFLNYLSK